jgi:hypothetical protein
VTVVGVIQGLGSLGGKPPSGSGAASGGSTEAGAAGAARGGGAPRIHAKYADGTVVLEGQQPARLPTGPDPSAGGPHTRLRLDPVNNRVYQGREFNDLGPVCDIDFTSPTYPNGQLRPDHIAPPHQTHGWSITRQLALVPAFGVDQESH